MAGVVDRGLVRLAQAFAGAWPYLELIAAGCGIGDPLDRRVVEAYWVGNDLLDKVPVTEIGDSMQDRFRHRTGRNFPFLAEGVQAGSRTTASRSSASTRGPGCWVTTARPSTRSWSWTGAGSGGAR